MSMLLIALTPSQVSTLQGYIDNGDVNGDYSEGYGFVKNVLDGANVNGDSAMQAASNWFGIAQEANGNTGFWGAFIRGAAEEAASNAGYNNFDDTAFQSVSNDLAQQVLSNIAAQGY